MHTQASGQHRLRSHSEPHPVSNPTISPREGCRRGAWTQHSHALASRRLHRASPAPWGRLMLCCMRKPPRMEMLKSTLPQSWPQSCVDSMGSHSQHHCYPVWKHSVGKGRSVGTCPASAAGGAVRRASRPWEWSKAEQDLPRRTNRLGPGERGVSWGCGLPARAARPCSLQGRGQ